MALTDSLVAYYKLDESSGNASDSVGGYTLTNNGTTGYESAKINNGANFANTNTKYLRRTEANVFGLTSNQNTSVSLWFKIVSEANQDGEICYLFWKSATGSLIRIFYYYNGGTRQLGVGRLGAVNNFNFITNNYGDNVWRHLVVTYDTSSLVVYINGVSASSVAGNGTYNSSGASQSAGFGLGDLAFGVNGHNGFIDEVGIYGKVLSLNEIQALYRAGQGNQFPFGSAFNNTLTPSVRASSGVSVTERTM